MPSIVSTFDKQLVIMFKVWTQQLLQVVILVTVENVLLGITVQLEYPNLRHVHQERIGMFERISVCVGGGGVGCKD